ncbi:hypothetical protein [Sessilibacter corallicola]|uniref:Transcriptional regulator SutA n=1 Tax=Sessilibacter corallicola TaxID=2904075 RepID=A0ABQ0A5T5_9GAMM
MSDDSNEDYEDNAADESLTDSESTGDGESSANADVNADYSLSVKEQERLMLQNQVEEFLAKGGKIDQIDANITADPPQKPSSNYGSRPI